MSIVRLRRLQADHAKLMEYVRQQPRVQVLQTDGDPPERYQLRYQVVGLQQKEEGMRTVKEHLVEIALPLNYPRLPPQCRMLTPVFHPNIAPHAICIGDHWSSGESLTSIVARIGELLSFQSYNTKSPLNGEAARWVDQNMDSLPLDSVSFVPNDAPVAAPPTNKDPDRPALKISQPVPEVIPLDEQKHPIDDEDAPIPVEPVHPPRARNNRESPPIDQPAKNDKSLQPTAGHAPVGAAGNAGSTPEKARVACPSCDAKLKVSYDLFGTTVHCPACNQAINLPKRMVSQPAAQKVARSEIRMGQDVPEVIPLDDPAPSRLAQPDPVSEKIRLTCPSCDARLKIGSDLAGKTVRCPACKNALVVPSEDRQ